MVEHVVRIARAVEDTVLIFKRNEVGFMVIDRCGVIDVVPPVDSFGIVSW